MLGIVSLSVNAYQDTSSHIDLTYSDDCNAEYQFCVDSYINPPVFSLDSSNEMDLDAGIRPLHFTVQDEKDWDYLTEQTYTILGLSIITVGLMTLLPESITKWDQDSRDLSQLGDKWVENVKAGPVWDRDEHFLNYIMHPYFGGVYYTSARHAGFSEVESFGYSFAMSALFWEYGVEAFAEVPSWQDLFVTPFFGAMVGEMMLIQEQEILDRGGDVLGSETLGSISLFFLNPVGHIHYWATDAWGGSAEGGFTTSPWFNNQDAAKFALDSGAEYEPFYGVQLTLKF
jgi:hypothetical protein